MTLTPDAQAANLKMLVMLSGRPELSGSVAALDLEMFTEAEQMTNWEAAAWETYGEAAARRDDIFTLEDMFGEEWVKPWNRRRNALLAAAELSEAERDFVNAKTRLTQILATIANPPDYFPYYDNPEAAGA